MLFVVLLSVLQDPEIPHIEFSIPFPYQLAGAAATVTGYILIRAIVKLIWKG